MVTMIADDEITSGTICFVGSFVNLILVFLEISVVFGVLI